MELELSDEDSVVLYVLKFMYVSSKFSPMARYKIGEAFLHMPHPRALKRLARDQASIAEQVSSLSSSAEEYETKMKALKVALYAKFGKAINLDDD